jgi:hypothetical protein
MQKAQARMDHLREVANAELLDAEPKLHHLLERTLSAFMLAAIARQKGWLEGAMTFERETVAAEGKQLAPLARQRDRLKQDIAKLREGIKALEQENPGLAAAASPIISDA